MTKEKTRVLRIINRFNLGGPTYNVAYLTKYLGSEYETMLLGGEKDDSEASSEFILDKLGITARYIPEMKRSISLDDIKAYRKISRIIQEFKPHIVHTHASKAGTLGRLAAYHNNVPVILHTFHGHVFHSYFGNLTTNFYKVIERFLAGLSSKIIAISEQQKLEIGTEHKICSPDKIAIVPLGFDLTRFSEKRDEKRKDFRNKYELSDEEVAVVIVGRLVPIKNHRMFLDVAKRLVDAGGTHIRFFIVGDGESREEVIAYSKHIGLNHTWMEAPTEKAPLCFTSWIKEVDWVYAGCDIVCLTSLNEGSPVSLIEAQSAGLPIVSTKVGGIHDVVVENESALLSAKGDVEDFFQKLNLLIKDPDLRARFGSNGEYHVSVKYSYIRLIQDIEALYKDLLSQNSTPE
jgi:glycosyltransferase involved in cell wall biosynthesis